MGERWVDDVLSFWFEELTTEDWFKRSTEVDETIRSRFDDLYERLKSNPPEITDADTALAAIIVLDQFPRNMFRGEAAAFGSDATAAALTRKAVEAGFDSGIGQHRRAFMYMPLMHSESLSDQEKAVELFTALGNENSLKFCIEHRDVIARYGRFPHRNRALERKNTPDELEYLKTASGYGQ